LGRLSQKCLQQLELGSTRELPALVTTQRAVLVNLFTRSVVTGRAGRDQRLNFGGSPSTRGN